MNRLQHGSALRKPAAELLNTAQVTLASVAAPALYERALSSETLSSFEIERETPSSDKQERFVQLLRRAGEATQVTDECQATRRFNPPGDIWN